MGWVDNVNDAGARAVVGGDMLHSMISVGNERSNASVLVVDGYSVPVAHSDDPAYYADLAESGQTYGSATASTTTAPSTPVYAIPISRAFGGGGSCNTLSQDADGYVEDLTFRMEANNRSSTPQGNSNSNGNASVLDGDSYTMTTSVVEYNSQHYAEVDNGSHHQIQGGGCDSRTYDDVQMSEA